MAHESRPLHVWDNSNALIKQATEAQELSAELRQQATQLVATAKKLQLKLRKLLKKSLR